MIGPGKQTGGFRLRDCGCRLGGVWQYDSFPLRGGRISRRVLLYGLSQVYPPVIDHYGPRIYRSGLEDENLERSPRNRKCVRAEDLGWLEPVSRAEDEVEFGSRGRRGRTLM